MKTRECYQHFQSKDTSEGHVGGGISCRQAIWIDACHESRLSMRTGMYGSILRSQNRQGGWEVQCLSTLGSATESIHKYIHNKPQKM